MNDVVEVAERLAARLAEGATLLVHGAGGLEPDAHHVVVEFVHPVIVGKGAYPAVFVPTAEDAALLARPGDVSLALGEAPEFRRATERAGCVALQLDADDGGYVTGYHLLWEITQLLLEGRDRPATDDDLAFLYGEPQPERLRADARREAARKRAESAELRSRVLVEHEEVLDGCVAAVRDRVAAGGRVFTFGNGGSSTDAASVAQALRRARVGAVCLAEETAVVTALANDVGVEHVFARQLAALAGSHDVAVALSTSGGSTNVLAALAQARRRGVLTVGFAGYDGGAMATAGAVEHLFLVRSDSVHRIQEAQAALYLELAARLGRT